MVNGFHHFWKGVIKSAGRGQVNALNCSVRCPQRISSDTAVFSAEDSQRYSKSFPALLGEP